MQLELLTPSQMQEADRRAIAVGPSDGYALMLRAGAAVADSVLERFPAAARVDVLCGPGNNGGDGYVVAKLLVERGVAVSVWASAAPRKGSDAERAAADCPIKPKPLAEFVASPDAVVVDALFGAGLDRALSGAAAEAVLRVTNAGSPVVAVDIPSGVSGESGLVLGAAFSANLTVTFVRKKPGHVLYPGRALCGELTVADIGVSDEIVDGLGVSTFENEPGLWLLPAISNDAHKYSRGHVGVFSGGIAATGAARLSAMGAARIGAGAVTVLSPEAALAANAAHLTSIILRKSNTLDEALGFCRERRPAALVYGPGLGPQPETARFMVEMLGRLGEGAPTLVVDADGLSASASDPAALFSAIGKARCDAILTPHAGEFARLFPDIAADGGTSKLDKARAAANRSGCTVICKGPDTVIASPDGRAAINTNGTPLLATAGSGDALSGFIAGLAAQGMAAFEAACAAVWLHAEAADEFGPGLIAEDLPQALVPVLRRLNSWPVRSDAI